MSRISSSGRLGELLRIVGTQPADTKRAGSRSRKEKSATTNADSLQALRRDLAIEISSIDLSDESGREIAQRLLIQKVILNRFEKIQPNAAQLSYLAHEVSQKASARPELRELLDDVINELVAK